MTDQAFTLNFKGYWHQANIDSIPCHPGIYCVYECYHDHAKNQVLLRRLLYIGEAEDVNQRIKNHEKWPDWKKALKAGEELCFSFTSIITIHRVRIEAALIYKHKPPDNDDYLNSFPFDRTTILLTGTTDLLIPMFTVERTP
jgi:excinuclease UvrABC nuclease subunit